MANPGDGQIGLDFAALPSRGVLCRTEKSRGNGRIGDLTDIVFGRNWDRPPEQARAAAVEVRELDARLGKHGRRYLLIGPGRWGSSDPGLGIPVEWLHISHARVIAELPLRGEMLESSQGTHFFHNITSKQVGYLSLNGFPHRSDGENFLDLDYLDEAQVVSQSELVRHVRLPAPLLIDLDGAHSAAVLVKGEALEA